MMNKAVGFITLHRQILDWEWYKNINVKVLFLHLLLKANYKDLSFEGHKILRGQLVTSLPSLSAELGLSPKQIRGSLDHLISTGEVTSKTFPRYRIITIVRYDEYQLEDRLTGRQTAGERAAKGQAEGSQRAGSGQAEGRLRAASKQYNNSNNVKKGTMEQESETASRFAHPSREDIISFCQENGLVIDVDRFLDYYASNGWRVGKNPMKDWKATVRNWARKDKEPEKPTARPVKTVLAQQYSQRDYSGVQDDLYDEISREIDEMRKRGGA